MITTATAGTWLSASAIWAAVPPGAAML